MRPRFRVGSGVVALPARPVLSEAQLARLGALGDERRAPVGEVLYRDRRPDVSVHRDPRGRGRDHRRGGHRDPATRQAGFLGEMNLLTGQTVFVTAVVTEPLRYIAVEREALRALLFEDGPLSDLVLATLIARREALQQVEGIGLEIVGPNSSEATMRMLDFARSNRLPYTWDETTPRRPAEGELPLVRLPGGGELRAPSTGQVSRALGIGRELAPREEVDLVVVGGGPAGLGAAVYGASEGLETLVVEGTALGGQAGSSRRIENYLGFPAGITGIGADEPRGHAGAQVRRTHRDAVPRASRSSRERAPRRPARGGPRDRGARRHPRDRRAVSAAPGRGSGGLRGAERLLRGRPARGTAAAAPRASPSSAAATPRARPRSGSRAAARS